MLLGVGIDVASIDRIGPWLGRFSRRELGTVFSADELDEVAAHPEAMTRLTISFSAKEAVGKALGTGLGRIDVTDIIVHVESSELHIGLKGQAASIAAEMGILKWRGEWSRLEEFVMTWVVAEASDNFNANMGQDILLVNIKSDCVRRAMRSSNGRLAEYMMGSEELRYLCERREMIPGFAARLAAKYGVSLLLRQHVDKRWSEIQIARNAMGAPHLILTGMSADEARRLGVKQIYLSLTHEGPHAAAIVAERR